MDAPMNWLRVIDLTNHKVLISVEQEESGALILKVSFWTNSRFEVVTLPFNKPFAEHLVHALEAYNEDSVKKIINVFLPNDEQYEVGRP
ncbi:hypothetical protein TW85_24945 [Marinomonas sp. S3726]|uniref:hypothetical protein n=1 Tax=Marinomonas sp. S3726 TaxID=579484 RepID=UPI0005FA884A|nr:hypothetical protein [Marinomonas sp. S3726]KJZ07037.1 hypothetical protein TW85_24945 [Marinomonas sp. S3726]